MNWKKIGKRLLFPHPVIIALLDLIAAGLLIYSFICLESTSPVSIASYALSFYALVVTCCRTPDMVRFFLRIWRENKYVVRYTGDVRLRVNLSLTFAFALNAVFAVFQLALGIWHRSVWFYAMATYYLLLALMRLLLVRYTGSHAHGLQQMQEWKRYRFCGVCLLVMNLALAVMITYFVFRIRVFRHHEITVIAMAAHTFASLALAVRNVIRSTRYHSPAYSAARAISLVAAIVSVLTLENAMLTTFGAQSSERFIQIMLGATGAGVMLLVLTVSLYMLVKAHKNLRCDRSRAQ